jgi:hypothetical protein
MGMKIFHFGILCLAVGLISTTGCGGYKPSGVKSAGELSEEHKQQLKELDEQRSQEWGGAPKKR